MPFFGKFGPKSQNYQLKLKFVTETNSNMQNSMMLFSFLVFEWKHSFWANLVQKVQLIILSQNFGACTSSNMLNSIGMFTFFVYDWKYLFWENLVQKIKIISLSWNLFNGHRHFFCFSLEIPFLGKFGPKSPTYMFKLKFGT